MLLCRKAIQATEGAYEVFGWIVALPLDAGGGVTVACFRRAWDALKRAPTVGFPADLRSHSASGGTPLLTQLDA
jgi:hypothetical protein